MEPVSTIGILVKVLAGIGFITVAEKILDGDGTESNKTRHSAEYYEWKREQEESLSGRG